MARRARSLATLLGQVNQRWPLRDTRSDGWIGDAAHRDRPSDHNPNSAGVVTAQDFDEHTDRTEADQSVGRWLWEKLLASHDPRIKYVIYEGRMFSSYPISGFAPWAVRPGSGHFNHLHISVSSSPRLYDDPRAWDLGSGAADTTEDTMRRGASGHAVRYFQGALLNWARQSGAITSSTRGDASGTLWERAVHYGTDGDYGQTTEQLVQAYQRAAGVEPTGVIGDVTSVLLHRYADTHGGSASGGMSREEADARYARAHDHPYAPSGHGHTLPETRIP